MTIIKKIKRNFKKKHTEIIKIFLKKKETKSKKKLEKDIKVLLKKKKSFSVIVYVIRIFLRNKKEAIATHINSHNNSPPPPHYKCCLQVSETI